LREGDGVVEDGEGIAPGIPPEPAAMSSFAAPYRLRSIVVHEGMTPHSGHYWAVCRGLVAPLVVPGGRSSAEADRVYSDDTWRVYNDESVRTVHDSAVEADGVARGAYMLVYELDWAALSSRLHQ
jgi:ubiquitin C-terminal hydrolase